MLFFVEDRFFLRESWRAQRAAKADVCAVLDLDRCRLSLLGLEGLVSDILKYKREESNLVGLHTRYIVICLSICMNILCRNLSVLQAKFLFSRLQEAIQMKQVETDLKPAVAR